MTSLRIRRGTTKTFVLSINEENKVWTDLGTVFVRITQDQVQIDKLIEPIEGEPKKAKISYTQEDTIQLKEKKQFQLQVFSIVGPEETEIAAKSDIYTGLVDPSLWNEVIHND
jgi:hypothetical protein